MGNMLGGLDIGSLFGMIIQFKLIGALFGGDLFGGGGGGGMFGGGAPASTGMDGNMLGAILEKTAAGAVDGRFEPFLDHDHLWFDRRAAGVTRA